MPRKTPDNVLEALANALADPAETRKARAERVQSLADELGITPRQVNRLARRYDIPVTPIERVEERAQAHENAVRKWEIRQEMALKFIAGTLTIEAAALKASVSDRQLRRWVEKLLAREQLVPRDLTNLNLDERRRIAAHMRGKK